MLMTAISPTCSISSRRSERSEGKVAIESERIVAFDPVVGQEMDALLAHRDRAPVGRADHEHADARMVRERLGQVRDTAASISSSVIRSLLALK